MNNETATSSNRCRRFGLLVGDRAGTALSPFTTGTRPGTRLRTAVARQLRGAPSPDKPVQEDAAGGVHLFDELRRYRSASCNTTSTHIRTCRAATPLRSVTFVIQLKEQAVDLQQFMNLAFSAFPFEEEIIARATSFEYLPTAWLPILAVAASFGANGAVCLKSKAANGNWVVERATPPGER